VRNHLEYKNIFNNEILRKTTYQDAVKLLNFFLESNVKLGLFSSDINITYFMPIWYHHVVVAEYSKNIAKVLNFKQVKIRRIYTAALLHDVSKILWSEKLHTYPMKFLTKDEKQKIKDHPRESAEIIAYLTPEKHKRLVFDGDPSILDIILLHHEKPDGSGYYSVKDVPKSVAVVAMSDIFDACTENRPYRLRPMSPEDASDVAVKPFCDLFDSEEILMIKRTLISVFYQRNHYSSLFFEIERTAVKDGKQRR